MKIWPPGAPRPRPGLEDYLTGIGLNVNARMSYCWPVLTARYAMVYRRRSVVRPLVVRPIVISRKLRKIDP